jgi:hypothetical protein
MSARGGQVSPGTEVLVWICAVSNIAVFAFGMWKFCYETYREKLHLIKIVDTPFEHMTKKQQQKILEMVEIVAKGSNNSSSDEEIEQKIQQMRRMSNAGMLQTLVLDKKRGTIRSGVVVTSGEYKEDSEEEKAVVVEVKEDLRMQGSSTVLKRCEAYVTL